MIGSKLLFVRYDDFIAFYFLKDVFFLCVQLACGMHKTFLTVKNIDLYCTNISYHYQIKSLNHAYAELSSFITLNCCKKFHLSDRSNCTCVSLYYYD